MSRKTEQVDKRCAEGLLAEIWWIKADCDKLPCRNNQGDRSPMVINVIWDFSLARFGLARDDRFQNFLLIVTYDWNYVEGESLMQEDIYSMSNLTLTLSRNIIGQIINHIYICKNPKTM